MNTKESLIFYTGQVPINGMLSSVDPAALGPGQFALIDNFSIAQNRITARWGCDRLAPAPFGSASYRGSWSGYVAGNWTRLVAFWDSSALRIYHLDRSFTWNELTSASTRFAGDGFVDFAPITESGLTLAGTVVFPKQDGVICGNGVDEQNGAARGADLLH